MGEWSPLYSSADLRSLEPALDRDGISQENRALAALKADYAAIDDRTFIDLLSLAHRFSQELVFYNADGVASGDWSRFINPALLPEPEFSEWLKQIERFIEQPELFPEDRYPELRRPHFVLFLTFLKLLKNTQDQLNGITARHLDFYYRTVLDFAPKQAEPDHVHVLLDLKPGIDPVLLPKGTLLNAGKDSSGKDLSYRTDADLVVNHAQIARLSSVYVNKEIIGFPETRAAVSGTRKQIMAMLQFALGEPTPGRDLPGYPLASKEKTIDDAFLARLQKLLDFTGKDGLFLEIAELRELIRLKTSRGAAADPDWAAINSLLQNAAQTKRQDQHFIATFSNPRDFDNNLITALEIPAKLNGQTIDFDETMAFYFNTLPLVSNLNELYEQYERDDVQQFITDVMCFELDAFNQLMQTKLRIDDDWRQIYAILSKAGKRKDKANLLKMVQPPDFDTSFTSALGSPGFADFSDISGAVKDLESYYSALLDIEAYFYMSLESFRQLSKVAGKDSPSDEDWRQLDGILLEAHEKKVSAQRKLKLRSSAQNPVTDLAPMMRLALGLPPSNTGSKDELLPKIKELLPADTNLSVFAKTDALTDEDVDNIVNKLEIVWRNRVPILPPRIVNWLNLNAYADTAIIADSSDKDVKSWRNFGQRQTSKFTDKDRPPPASLGWAMSSPLLRLNEGERQIVLIISFNTDNFDAEKITQLFKKADSPPFKVELSTAKGWLSPNEINTNVITTKSEGVRSSVLTIIWSMTVSETGPAITTLENAENGLNTDFPVLRLLLQPLWNGKFFETPYNIFQNLLLEEINLVTHVVGLKSCMIQNDEQKLPLGKPFEPFGSAPVVGSRLYFSHPELTSNPLVSLDLNLVWTGMAASDLSNYYRNYVLPGDGKITNSSFQANVVLCDQNQEIPLTLSDKNLFTKDSKKAVTFGTCYSDDKQIKTNTGYLYKRLGPTPENDNVTDNPRFFFLELKGCDFQHSAYPGLANKMAIQLAIDIADKKVIKADDYQVNPPFAPKLKKFTVDYYTLISIKFSDVDDSFPTDDCVYHLHPFGFAPLAFDQDSGGYRFLPSYDNEGELYIGFSGVDAPHTLSVLLQLAEGSANPNLAPAKVEWSVLDGNRWQPLHNGQLIEDGSNGLLQSGIVTFALEPVAPSTLLPADLYWLRASIKEGCDSVSNGIGFHAQAVTATLADQENADDHYAQPLPANTISALATPIAGLEIAQPYTSFGVKAKEADSHFNTRISERLRHKQRALSVWDYEHIVLERYPEIYKAKCLPLETLADTRRVVVIVIPDIRNRLPFNPFEPKASSALLADIESYLQSCVPLGVGVSVRNARYLPVKLRLDVRLKPGCDSGYYRKQLNEDINRFLSPWAYDEGEDIVIGGKIYANAIIDHVDRLAYIDSVQNFKMFLCPENSDMPQWVPKPDLNVKAEGYAVSAGRLDTVLVAAETHEIGLITDIQYGENNFTGINYMKIGLDFIVA